MAACRFSRIRYATPPEQFLTQRVILLVDDSSAVEHLLRAALKKCGAPIDLHVKRTAEEAVRHAVDAPAPDLILLDISLPDGNGLVVLRCLRLHPPYQDIPILMFSSSHADADMQRARAQGATAYLIKPVGLAGYSSLIGQLAERWLCVQCAGLGTPEQ